MERVTYKCDALITGFGGRFFRTVCVQHQWKLHYVGGVGFCKKCMGEPNSTCRVITIDVSLQDDDVGVYTYLTICQVEALLRMTTSELFALVDCGASPEITVASENEVEAFAEVTSSPSNLPANTGKLTDNALEYGLAFLFSDEHSEQPPLDVNLGWVGDISNSERVDDFSTGAGNNLGRSRDDNLALNRQKKKKKKTGAGKVSHATTIQPCADTNMFFGY